VAERSDADRIDEGDVWWGSMGESSRLRILMGGRGEGWEVGVSCRLVRRAMHSLTLGPWLDHPFSDSSFRSDVFGVGVVDRSAVGEERRLGKFLTNLWFQVK
jgi:hypothetical protein